VSYNSFLSDPVAMHLDSVFINSKSPIMCRLHIKTTLPDNKIIRALQDIGIKSVGLANLHRNGGICTLDLPYEESKLIETLPQHKTSKGIMGSVYDYFATMQHSLCILLPLNNTPKAIADDYNETFKFVPPATIEGNFMLINKAQLEVLHNFWSQFREDVECSRAAPKAPPSRSTLPSELVMHLQSCFGSKTPLENPNVACSIALSSIFPNDKIVQSLHSKGINKGITILKSGSSTYIAIPYGKVLECCQSPHSAQNMVINAIAETFIHHPDDTRLLLPVPMGKENLIQLYNDSFHFSLPNEPGHYGIENGYIALTQEQFVTVTNVWCKHLAGERVESAPPPTALLPTPPTDKVKRLPTSPRLVASNVARHSKGIDGVGAPNVVEVNFGKN